MSLKNQVESLTAQKEALNKKIELLTNQLNNQPVMLEPAVAQRVLDLRDDVEYYARRLNEAQNELAKFLKENGFDSLDIKITVPKRHNL